MQLDRGYSAEINGVVFYLSCSTGRAEEELLTHDRRVRNSAVRRPSHGELLGALLVRVLENEMDQPDGLRVVEDQPDDLLAWRRRAPAIAAFSRKRRLDRIPVLLGSELDSGHVRHGQPVQRRSRVRQPDQVLANRHS